MVRVVQVQNLNAYKRPERISSIATRIWELNTRDNLLPTFHQPVNASDNDVSHSQFEREYLSSVFLFDANQFLKDFT